MVKKISKVRPYGKTFDPKGNLTKQSFKAECDINTIVRRHLDFGVELPEAPPQHFMDCTGITFAESLSRVREAQEAFDALPAHMRAEMRNDPQNYINWINENQKEIDENGLKAVMAGYLNPEEPQRDFGKFRRQEKVAQTDAQKAADDESVEAAEQTI